MFNILYISIKLLDNVYNYYILYQPQCIIYHIALFGRTRVCRYKYYDVNMKY